MPETNQNKKIGTSDVTPVSLIADVQRSRAVKAPPEKAGKYLLVLHLEGAAPDPIRLQEAVKDPDLIHLLVPCPKMTGITPTSSEVREWINAAAPNRDARCISIQRVLVDRRLPGSIVQSASLMVIKNLGNSQASVGAVTMA